MALIFLAVPAEEHGCAVLWGQPCSVLCPQERAGQPFHHPPVHCTKVLTTGGIRGIAQPKCQHLQYLPPHSIPGSLWAQQRWQGWAVSRALTCAIVQKLTWCTDYHGACANCSAAGSTSSCSCADWSSCSLRGASAGVNLAAPERVVGEETEHRPCRDSPWQAGNQDWPAASPALC